MGFVEDTIVILVSQVRSAHILFSCAFSLHSSVSAAVQWLVGIAQNYKMKTKQIYSANMPAWRWPILAVVIASDSCAHSLFISLVSDMFLCRRLDIFRETTISKLWSSPHICSVDILDNVCVVADYVRTDYIRDSRLVGIKFKILSLAFRIDAITVYGNCFDSVLYSLLQH